MRTCGHDCARVNMLYAYIFNYGKLLAEKKKKNNSHNRSQLLQPPDAVATAVGNVPLQRCHTRSPRHNCVTTPPTGRFQGVNAVHGLVALVIVSPLLPSQTPSHSRILARCLPVAAAAATAGGRVATVNCVAASRELKLISCRHGA